MPGNSTHVKLCTGAKWKGFEDEAGDCCRVRGALGGGTTLGVLWNGESGEDGLGGDRGDVGCGGLALRGSVWRGWLPCGGGRIGAGVARRPVAGEAALSGAGAELEVVDGAARAEDAALTNGGKLVGSEGSTGGSFEH